MRKSGTKSAFRIVFVARLKLKLADCRHNQKIAQIRMSRAGKMRVRKSDNLFVVILITCAVFISFIIIFPADQIRLLVRVGRQLHRAERYGRAGKCMSHFLRSDQRIDVLNIIFRFLCQRI